MLFGCVLCITVSFPRCQVFSLHCNIRPEKRPTSKSVAWSLNVFKHVQFMYGFPLDFMGGQIGTVYTETRKCLNNTWFKEAQCARVHVTKHCHLPVDVMKNFTYMAKDCIIDVDTKENGSQSKQTALTIGSNENMHYVGQYNSERINSLNELFASCATSCKNLKLVAGIYVCDFLTYLNTLGSGKRNLEGAISWDMSEENLYGLFLYWLCHVTWPKLSELNPSDIRLSMMILCPNPCSVRAARCSRIPNTLPSVRSPSMLAAFSESSCIQLGTDLTENNYECLCKPGYQWDASSKQCVLKDLCAEDAELARTQGVADSERLCSPSGTLRCVPFASQPLRKPVYGSPEETYSYELRIISTHQCVCRPGYMGYRCDRLRNSCIEARKSFYNSGIAGHPSGNSACRTYLGNKCHAILGTSIYSCQCTSQWKQNGSLPFANCYLEYSACDRVLCHNGGSCVESPDHTNYKCLCQYGWQGEFCETRDVRHWLPWAPWSLCSASLCTGSGWQQRQRQCRVPVNHTTGYGQCKDGGFELRPCSAGCIHPLQTFIPMIKIFLMFAICLLFLQLAVGFILLVLRFDIIDWSTRSN
ncbi:Cadherin tumor suppressor [Paragonimus heterotremus]|uniref:Cadherin tumor suppressor n=1 Tax=Paragonimus heterotremus TaxID=100268 RepID=A0A8J4TQS5_9TREM|nr:Cadherin tumor suppressor [Paragonimus heterotremus]